MMIFFHFTLTSGTLLQLLSLCCKTLTKYFILDLSTLSKTFCRILTIVLISVFFCKECVIVLKSEIVLFIFCVITKNGKLISVDLSFCPILTLMSAHPSKGNDLVVTPLDPGPWILMVSHSSRIEMICWILTSGKFSKFFFADHGN